MATEDPRCAGCDTCPPEDRCLLPEGRHTEPCGWCGHYDCDLDCVAPEGDDA